MNGRKAKALRKIVGYRVTVDRPELPHGQWASDRSGTCRLPTTHPRRQYHTLKKRYHMVPFAHLYKRISRTRDFVDSFTPPQGN